MREWAFLCGLIAGALLYRLITAKRCKHDWCIQESGEKIRGNGSRAGIYKIYECGNCKKMKTETSDIQ